jgi:hypothetical protein
VTIWEKELREFAASPPALLRRALVPFALSAPLLLLGPPSLQLPVLAILITGTGWWSTGAQVARERSSGLLHRLTLAPVRPGALLLQKLGARSVIACLQVLPPSLLVAVRTGAAPAALPSPIHAGAGPTALHLVAFSLALTVLAVASGGLAGLLSTNRRQALLAGAVTAAGVAAAAWYAAQTGWIPGAGWAGAVLLLALLVALLGAQLCGNILFSQE